MKRSTVTRRAVLLASGGHVAVTLRMPDLLRMEPRDREFVFAIVDGIDAYERAQRRRAAHEATLARWADDGGRSS